MLKLIPGNDTIKLKEYLMNRESEVNDDVVLSVNEIINNVRKNKDQALFDYSEKFDGVKLNSLVMSEEEIDEAIKHVDPEFIKNMEDAAKNIELYHNLQKRDGYEIVKDNGVVLGQRILPLNTVGVYVPGGRAAYPSSVLMNVIPAKIAGVNDIIMVTPPNKEGSVNPYIAAAARIAGVNKIYKVGGAQAVAALAYGSETIPQVDKIVGPGNMYVATAKKLVYGKVDIDMIAGPSEILVIADEFSNPSYVAADLLSQAEHDPMASSILLTTSAKLLDEVNKELRKQSAVLPKKDIVEASLNNFGISMILDTIEEAIEISNIIAPEHLELQVKDAKDYLDLVINAGSVFLGYYTCESLGDYFCGTNHVLPTSGTARFYSPLNVDNFMKKSSYSYYPLEALKEDGNKVINIAEHEGLRAHANAVKVRLDNEGNK